jgi:hypothetical protein
MPHAPFVQMAASSWSEVHTVPQVPQFVLSLRKSTQAPLHAVKPGEHSIVQPSLQTALPCSGTGHTAPQAPQCAGLELKSTQLPLHDVSPAAQVATHRPAEQTSSLWQR